MADHANVEAGAVEQPSIDRTSPRDSISMSKSSAPVAAMPAMPSSARPGWRTRPRSGKRESAHRLARFSTPLRSSVHDDTRLASTPSGTAKSTHCSAMRGVMRTNTSAVSYRHWKKR